MGIFFELEKIGTLTAKVDGHADKRWLTRRGGRGLCPVEVEEKELRQEAGGRERRAWSVFGRRGLTCIYAHPGARGLLACFCRASMASSRPGVARPDMLAPE